MNQNVLQQARAKLWKYTKRALIGFVIVIVVLIVIGAIVGPSNTEQSAPQQQTKANTETKPSYQYEVINKIENNVVENLDVLVNPGETQGEAIAMEVKKTCKKQCNINVFDDRKALDLQAAYSKLVDPTEMEAWKKQNYVYVADHYIGSVDFSSGGYDEYPFKDWYYKELKGK